MKTLFLIGHITLLTTLFSTNSWAANPKAPLGINSNATASSTADIPFKNLIYKIARSWSATDSTTGATLTGPVHVDSDGYPLADLPNANYSASVALNMPGGPYPGDYVMLWDGTGIVDSVATSNDQVGDHRTTFTLPPKANGWRIIIKNDSAADPVHNIRIIPEPYENDYLTDPFQPDFIQYLSKFNTFRFMDLSGVSVVDATYSGTAAAVGATTVRLDSNASTTNGAYKGWFVTLVGTGGAQSPQRLVTDYNGVTKTATFSPALTPGSVTATPAFILQRMAPAEWAQRRKPTEINQSGSKGMAVEYMIAMCNKSHTSPWFTLPLIASDDYIQQFATYVKANLDPTLKIYIEYGNETWKSGGPGYTVCNAMGQYLGLAGNPVWSYHAYRASHIFSIWNSVYGVSNLSKGRAPNPLVRVLASQSSSYDVGTSILDFNAWPAGDPLAGHTASEYGDLLAIAPYFAAPSNNDVLTQSATSILDALQQSVDNYKSPSADFVMNLQNAQARSMDLGAYAGGFGMFSTGLTAAQWDRLAPLLHEIVYSPRMRTLYLDYLNIWSNLGANAQGKGAKVFNVYNAYGVANANGYLGHRDMQTAGDADGNQKGKGLEDYLNDRVTPMYPNRLQANPVGETTVHLIWTDNSNNETGFRLERSLGANGTFSPIATLAANVTEYVDLNLFPNTLYAYRVVAVNNNGGSEYSNIAQAQTPSVDAVIPEAPSDLTVAPESPDSFLLRWKDHSLTETKFVIQRKLPTGTVFTTIATVGPNETEFINTNLSGTGLFTYRVAAANGAWLSNYSDPAAAPLMPAGDIPGDTPSNFKAVVDTNSIVHLTWTDKSGAEQTYLVQRATEPEGPFVTIADVGANAVAYLDTGAEPGFYYYELSLQYPNGTTLSSTRVTAFVPGPAFSLPLAPTKLVATQPIINTVQLTWIDNSDNETAFQVERSPDGTQWSSVGQTAPNATSFSDNSPTGALAYYRVKAIKAADESAYSNLVVVDSTKLLPPSNLIAQASDASTINLTWQNNDYSATSVHIEKGTSQNGPFSEIGNVPFSANTFQDANVVYGTFYYYRVRVLNGTKSSDYSNVAGITIAFMFELPSPPSGVTATAISASEIDLSWTGPGSQIIGYNIERMEAGKNFQQITLTPVSAESYADQNLQSNTQYFYRLATVNSAGQSAYSTTVDAKTIAAATNPTTPGGDATANTILKINPNPLLRNVRTFTLTNLPKGNNITVRVFTRKGETILNTTVPGGTSAAITLPNNIPSGVYGIHVKGDTTKTGRVVVAK